MIEAKFSNCNLEKNQVVVSTLSKHQPAPQKAPLRDAQFQRRRFVPKSSLASGKSSLPKGTDVNVVEAANRRLNTECSIGHSLPQLVCGHEVKKPRFDCPQIPARIQSSCSGANGQLVYARRKTEPEEWKAISLMQPVCHGSASMDPQITLVHTRPCIPDSSPIQFSGNTQVCPTSALQSSPNEKPRDKKHWKQRFEDLQEYLKSCDESSREVYVQRLRSFSATERSRHAVDLEIRAIQLSVMEVREFQKIMTYNVMDKAAPRNAHFCRSIPAANLK